MLFFPLEIQGLCGTGKYNFKLKIKIFSIYGIKKVKKISLLEKKIPNFVLSYTLIHRMLYFRCCLFVLKYFSIYVDKKKEEE